LSEPEFSEQQKRPSTDALPSVCYAYFTEFSGFKEFLTWRTNHEV
jgi:hypothetical protein